MKTFALAVIVVLIIGMGYMAGASLFIEGDYSGGSSISSNIVEAQSTQLGIIMLVMIISIFAACRLKNRLLCYD